MLIVGYGLSQRIFNEFNVYALESATESTKPTKGLKVIIIMKRNC